MTNEPTNADRAEWAKQVLAYFTYACLAGRPCQHQHQTKGK
jgi:hypothetical protein